MRRAAAVLLAAGLIGCTTAGGDRPIEISVFSGTIGPPRGAIERTITHDDRALFGSIGAPEPCGAVPPERARELRRLARSEAVSDALSNLASRPRGPARLTDLTFLVGTRETVVPAGAAPAGLRPFAEKFDEILAAACGTRYTDPVGRAMSAPEPSGGGPSRPR